MIISPCYFLLFSISIVLAFLLPSSSISFIYFPKYVQFVGPDGQPSWCVDDDEPLKAVFAIGNSSAIGYWEGAPPGEIIVSPFAFYLYISVVYTILDIALSLAIWSAASVGTPTQPRGRDVALRSLIWIKITFMNLLLIAVLASGIYFVHVGRRTNYGCGETEAVEQFEGTPWYTMFCLVMFTYAFELLLWPCICVNQIGKSITLATNRSRIFGFIATEERRHRNTAACLGGCFKCLQCLSCNQLGGGKIRVQADLKDAAVTFMDFFNLADANFDITLSDVYLAFKMLRRVHRERKYKISEQARMDKKRNAEGRLVPQPVFGLVNGNADNEGARDNLLGKVDMFCFLSTQRNL